MYSWLLVFGSNPFYVDVDIETETENRRSWICTFGVRKVKGLQGACAHRSECELAINSVIGYRGHHVEPRHPSVECV